jgi:hypothetical protein
MKLTVAQLKQLIAEVLSQTNFPPGRAEYTTGEPYSDDELDQLYYDGFPGSGLDEEDDLSEEIVGEIVREGIMLEQLGVLDQFELDLEAINEEALLEAEYRGHKVTLGKPTRGDVKKYKVYVKDKKTGNVKKVNFGDPNMEIRRDNPKARKSFRARHGCGTSRASDRTKAAFWSCKMWSKKPVSKILKGK